MLEVAMCHKNEVTCLKPQMAVVAALDSDRGLPVDFIAESVLTLTICPLVHEG